jgi:hypothetical protein
MTATDAKKRSPFFREKAPEAARSTARKLYAKGEKVSAIAAEVGYSKAWVVACTKDMPRRTHGPVTWSEHKIIVKLLRSRMTIAQVSKKLGRSRETVLECCRVQRQQDLGGAEVSADGIQRKGTLLHMSVSIEWALRHSDRDLEGLFVCGPENDANGIREWLRLHQRAGHKLLPLCKKAACPDFNHQTGCPGHPRIVELNA